MATCELTVTNCPFGLIVNLAQSQNPIREGGWPGALRKWRLQDFQYLLTGFPARGTSRIGLLKIGPEPFGWL